MRILVIEDNSDIAANLGDYLEDKGHTVDFAADGVTAVAGKGPLNQGTDYSLNFSAAPNCQLNITMLTAWAGGLGTSREAAAKAAVATARRRAWRRVSMLILPVRPR